MSNLKLASSEENEKIIWGYLAPKINNDFGTAGMIGNLYAESTLNSNNLQNSFERKLGMNDVQYTEAVNNGSYANFIHDGAGYGLAQWTYWNRKQNLQNLARSRKVSIDYIYMQLDYLWQELNTSYSTVLDVLKSARSIKEASDAVLTGFEKPLDQSDSMKATRTSYGQYYYDKYANGSVPTSSYIYNGVDYAPVFDPVYYYTKYSDLYKAFGTDSVKLFNHFTEYGMVEARQASRDFNPHTYKDRYSDLRKAFGNDWPKYYEHYCVYGIKEGRSGV